VGIDAIWIYLRAEYHGIRALLERELERLRAAPPLSVGTGAGAGAGTGAVAGAGAGADWAMPTIELRRGAGAYICGEESAMIESIEGKRGEAWSGSAATDGDEQVVEAILNRLAGVDGLGDNLDGAEGFEAVGCAFQDEHCGTTRAVVGAPAIHQGEDVVRAVVVEIGACDVVVIRFDFGVDFLEGGLSEGKGRRRGVGEAGEGEQEEEGCFHGWTRLDKSTLMRIRNQSLMMWAPELTQRFLVLM
jgi:hypothetical protein